MDRSEYLGLLNTLMLDAAATVCRLNDVNLRDGWKAVALAIQEGRDEYRELVARHAALDLSPSDSASVQALTDGVLTRVQFLEKHC